MINLHFFPVLMRLSCDMGKKEVYYLFTVTIVLRWIVCTNFATSNHQLKFLNW